MKKRLLSTLLAFCMVLMLLPKTAFAMDVIASGTCGKNLTWVLDSTGTLTISGAGATEDYVYATTPWFVYSNDIIKVVIEDGIISIERGAFGGCRNLTSVTIPNSVTNIGVGVFGNCSSLSSITIPNSVTSIGNLAFGGCRNLTSVTIPNNITSIGYGAFDRCSRLTSITIPNSVTSIEDYTFFYCSDLASVTIPETVTSIGNSAFADCGSLTDVYYSGSENQWKQIFIDDGNALLLNATIHYNWTGTEQNPDFLGDKSYYSTTENRLFRVYALNSSYPCPIGFTVGVGGASYTGYRDGNHFYDDITAVIPESYSGNIVVSKDGYYTYQIPAALTDNSNAITMVPTSITGPFSQALLLDKSSGNTKFYSNLLVENAMVYESTLTGDNTDILNLYPVVNWNGHGEGKILLVQGDKQVELKNNTFNEVNMTTYRFVANKPVYLQIVGADGVQTQIETGIHIYERWKSGIGIDLGSALEIDTEESEQEEVDIFAGESFKLDFSALSDSLVPISFSIKDDGTVTGTIGVTFDDGSYKEAAFGEIKEMLTRMADPNQTENLHGVASYLSKLKKQGIKPASSHSSWGVSGDAQIIGYFSGNIKDGHIGLTETKMALVLEGSASYTWNTFVAEIPAYIKVALKAQLETYLKMVYDEQLDKLTSDGKQTLKGSLGISAEAGPGWEGYVSVGIKGSGNVNANSVIPISKDDTSFSMQADLSVVGSLAGIRGSWKLVSSPEMIFWDAGEWCWKDKDSKNKVASFAPDLDINLMSFSSAGDSIADGVSGYTAPVLAQISGDRLLAVWIADVEGRNAVDKGGVYYSVLDNGTWSQPELVYDDNTNDSVPQLYQRDGITYLTWQNYTTTFNTDSLPDYDTIVAQLENVTSQFDPDSNQWSQPVVETPDWYLVDIELPDDYEGEWPITSTTRQVIDFNGIRVVLYTATDEDGQYQVYGIFDSGDGWGSPVQVTEATGGVNGFSAILDENNLSILYTTGDLSAASLVLQTSAIETDLTVNYADYLPETLVPGNTLTLAVSLQNSGPIPIDGVHISVLINGNEVHQENVDVALKSGEEELLFVGYDLPEKIDFTSLDVKVVPISGGDADLTDNIVTCALSLCDLSLENISAIQAGNTTQVLTQIVNRGQNSTAPVTMTFYKSTSDGEVIGTMDVPALGVGELTNLTVELSGLDVGDMVYAELGTFPNENLVSNNGSQATVIKDTMVTVDESENPVNPKPTTYTVTFTGGPDATGIAPTQADTAEGNTFSLPENTFQRTGYTFSGWNDGVKTYQSGDIYTMPGADVTFIAQWKKNAGTTDPNPSSGGGGSSSSNYSINVPAHVTGGTVTVRPTSASADSKVTITAKPNSGYKVGSITVTDKDGKQIAISDAGDNKYTFIMPKSKVDVKVEFVQIQDNLSFTDVQLDAYYYDAVVWAVEKNITAGTSATTFSPDASCTRAQIVTFLWRAAGSPKASVDSPFTDVPVDSYYYDAVLWAVEQGITSGTSATTFSPDATCTRAQAVTFLYRYEKSPAISGTNNFTDVDTDAYYADAVQWAVDKNVTAGTSATTFSPNATCTRAQIVTFLYRDMA